MDLKGSSFPQWMRWEELELLPIALKEVVLRKHEAELGAFFFFFFLGGGGLDCFRLQHIDMSCRALALSEKFFKSFKPLLAEITKHLAIFPELEGST